MSLLTSMATYVRVAELSSFTQAALSLGQTKASTSSAVARLEAQLGTRLLQRTTRRVQMTADGRAYFERCKDLLADVDELHSLFRPSRAGLTGRLRVDMPMGAARNTLIPQLPQFLQAHPGLQLELSSTDRRVDLVREGFDCVLRVGALGDSSLVARPLGHYAQVNCASLAYVKQHGSPQTLADLAHHQLVHYTPTLGARSTGFEYTVAGAPGTPSSSRFVPMAGAVSVNNSEAYQAACLAGLGIIQAPEAGLRPWVLRGQLVEVLTGYRPAPLPVALLYPHRRQLSQRCQAFMDWVAQVMAPHLLP
jgi:DNA-binding transcriptional LysR family regulator